MPVDIRGKSYLTVAERIQTFRKDHPKWGICTTLVESGNPVIVKAEIVMPWELAHEEGLDECRSLDSNEPYVIATGWAEEDRTLGNINKTSAVENCETSAIGRALAALGYAGSEYASADEVSNAIVQQAVKDAVDGFLSHQQAVRDNFDTVAYVKECLATEKIESAIEALAELDQETKGLLWKAPTKGGIFTTAERDMLKMPSKYKETENA